MPAVNPAENLRGFSGPRARLRLLDGTSLGTAYVIFHRPAFLDDADETEYEPWWGFIEFNHRLRPEHGERLDAGETFVVIEGTDPQEPPGGSPLELRVTSVSSGIREGRHCYLVWEATDSDS